MEYEIMKCEISYLLATPKCEQLEPWEAFLFAREGRWGGWCRGVFHDASEERASFCRL